MGDNDGGVQLEVKDQSFRPIWKDDAGEYLRGIRERGSSAIEKRERQRKREMEKSASTTGSIVDKFSAQLNKNQSQDKCASSAPSLAIFPPKHEVKETRAVH